MAGTFSNSGGPLVPMPQMTTGTTGGKGGSVAQPTSPYQSAPTATQAPSAAPQWNVNTAAAQGLQSAMANTAMGQYYQPQQVQASQYNPASMQAAGYNAAQAGSTGYGANTWQAGQLAGTSLNPYMNPYENTVIQGLQSDAARAQQMGSNQLGSAATAAKAFGGSRHGLAEGTMMAENQRNLNQQVGQLRQSGFLNAQQMAQQDIANRMSASQANQAAINAARQFGAGAQNTAALQNQQALNAARQFGASAANTAAMQNQNAFNQAGQYNAGNRMTAQQLNQQAGLQGAQQRLGAASQLGNLSNLGFGMGQTINQNMMNQGAMQQALQQQVMNKAATQYQGAQNAPLAAMSMLTQALGGTPYPQNQTQTSNAGLFDYLSLGAMMYGMR